MPTMSGCWKWAIGILSVPLILLFALFVWAKVDPAPADPRLDFLVACKSAVRDHLKAPSSATFGPETVRDVLTTASGYRLTGTVEAQNSFGVKLKTAYACTGSPDNPEVGIF